MSVGKICGLLMAGALSLPATNWYVTVAGLGGEQEYETRFVSQAMELDKLLKASGPDVKCETFSGASATRDKIKASLQAIAKQAKPEDSLVVILIGHGTHDGLDYKLNLPGPDLSGTDLASLLDAIPTGKQLVINTTSASGGAIDVLRRENRALITSTRNGTEKNAPVFARYVVEAFRDVTADTDKNDVLSALEVFKYADQKTVKFYETQKRLATEHAFIEDTGKGSGVRAPSAENGEGLLASRFPLLRLGSSQAMARDPEKQKLLARKETLEGEIDKLKYQKAAMPVDDYRKQLSALLLELAKTQAELDK